MNQTSIKNTQGKGIKLFKWNTAYYKPCEKLEQLG